MTTDPNDLKKSEKSVSTNGYIILAIVFICVLFKYRWQGFFASSAVVLVLLLIFKFEEYQLSKTPKFKVIEFDPSLASKFKEINVEWITKMFHLEAKDEMVLDNPQSKIIENGGHIVFVSLGEKGIVGTCALLKTGEDEYELTKMGVLESARGSGAGHFLLKETIQKAKSIGAKKLYLLSNSKCEAAIHLYEIHGFKHDKAIMEEFGQQYERCDVAMKYEF